MRFRVRAIVLALSSILFSAISLIPLHAQENGVPHPMSLAELTYGQQINAMVPDGDGGFWFGGYTCSTTLPTTSNAIQKSWSGPACGSIGLLGRMKADGSITYLSYFGGNNNSTVITALALGPGGNLFVAGSTYGADFPTTSDAYQRTLNRGSGSGEEDGFVSALSPDGSQFIFSTYLGGGNADMIMSIAVDSSARVYVGGSTTSSDFPVTSGALQSAFAGGGGFDELPTDGFYARLSPDGSSLQYATYIGGSNGDYVAGLALDPSGAAYVTGRTYSKDFPTLHPSQANLSGVADAFLARFGASGPIYSTYLGGSGIDLGTGVAVANDKVYITGQDNSPDFPGGAGTPTIAAFITELSSATGAVSRSVAINGTDVTAARGGAIAVDHNDVAYLAGDYSSSVCKSCGPQGGRYPATWDAYERQMSSANTNAVLSIVDFRPARPTVTYSTMLGGSLQGGAVSVMPDGTGGAFFAGWTQSPFPSVNAQAEPPADENGATQSFVAHVSAQQVTMPTSPSDIVLYGYDANGISPTAITGNWTIDEDATAAGGWTVHEPDQGAAKIAAPAANPQNYFELEFLAQADVMYHLWLRMKADNDSYQNDSAWVQFSDSVDGGGNPVWRIGSTDGTGVVLEDCSGCGEQGWGWNDNGYDAAGTPVMFATSGWHTIRIQQREDGIAIDQIVLSSDKWANTAPGANKNDATTLPQSYALPSGDQPITLSITNPSNGATFTAPADITIIASATDTNGPVRQVDVYANNVQIGELDRAPYLMTWQHVPAGTYSLTAVATDDEGEAASSPISITVNGNASSGLPSGWTDVDVGFPRPQGFASYANGTFTVQGAGRDVWGSSDSFNYLYMPLAGDGWIAARVATVSNQANWVKAGVMIRGSLSPSSPQAFMLVSSAKGVAFQRRSYDGDTSVSSSGSASTAPHWVKLVRSGGTISGFESADGLNWTLVGSDTFEMDSPAFVGLAVSSHVDGTLATATFDSVEMSGPAGWGSTDIGNVPFPGNSTYSARTFSVTGSGADIWGTSDAFHYDYTTLNGDGTIIARVATVQNVNAWVKAGVMIRETLEHDSPHAFALVSASKGIAFQRRNFSGEPSVNTAGSASVAPHWVKLTRAGNTFTTYESDDGTNWTLIGSDTVPMVPMVYVGLAVTSHNTSASATCTFDNVSVR